jgi:hypothetical protein
VTSSAALPPFAPRNMNPTASAAIPFVLLLLAPHAAAASTSQRTRRRRRNKRGTVGAGREWEGWIAVATGWMRWRRAAEAREGTDKYSTGRRGHAWAPH